MIEVTFEEFHDYKFIEEGFELYVMKNGLGDVLYVGITTQNIWSRWFAWTWNGHIIWDGNRIYGQSAVGEKIVDHLPDSLEWKIQLWTLDDCVFFCKDILPSRLNFTIQFVESFMLQKLSPILNVTYNLNPGKDRMPKSEREKKREDELDKAYYEIFEKKLKKSIG